MDGTPILDIKPYISEYDYPWPVDKSSMQIPIDRLSLNENCSNLEDQTRTNSQLCIQNKPDWISSKGVVYEPVDRKSEFDVINLNEKISDHQPSKNGQFEVIFTERSTKQLQLFHSKETSEHSLEHLIEDVNDAKNLYLNYGKSKDFKMQENDSNEHEIDKNNEMKIHDVISGKESNEDKPTTNAINVTTSSIRCKYCYEFLNSVEEARSAIINILVCDPRSSYRRKKCSDRLYYFTLDSMHISAWFDEEEKVIEIVKIKPNYL